MEKKILTKVIAAIIAPLILVGVAFCVTQNNTLFKRVSANAYDADFDENNSPALVGGAATVTDRRGITWEYSNASDYANGHVSLSNEGYFGISSSSPYGLKGVTGVSATFNAKGNELWLLKSVDGVTWSEDVILESDGDPVLTSNNWQYLRFYCYSSNDSTVDIDLVHITYSCTSISATEDVDSAKAANVVTTSSNLTYAKEETDISPNSIDGEAISFTKTDSAKSDMVIGFGTTYKVGPTQNAKIEFDMKTANINYGKTIQLMNGSATLGGNIDSSKASSYKCTPISGNWHHIEVPITTLISTISGYDGKDKPHTDVENKEYNAIKINAGTCVIDNLRLSGSPCELGIFNNPTYKPLLGEKFWLKVSWVGVLYPEQVSMSFSDNTLARKIPLDDPLLMNGSPFYFEILGSGNLTITCNVTCGYNRRVYTIQHTITIA